MKLNTLFENSFQNKPYESVEEEIDHIDCKMDTILKARTPIEAAITAIRAFKPINKIKLTQLTTKLDNLNNEYFILNKRKQTLEGKPTYVAHDLY